VHILCVILFHKSVQGLVKVLNTEYYPSTITYTNM